MRFEQKLLRSRELIALRLDPPPNTQPNVIK